MHNSYEYYSYVIRDKRFWKVYDDMAKIVSKVMGYKLIKAESVNLSHQCKTGIPHNKIERVLAKLKAEYGSNFSYSVFSEELYIVYFKERVDVSDVEIATDAGFEWTIDKDKWVFMSTSDIAHNLRLKSTGGLKAALEKNGAVPQRKKLNGSYVRGFLVPPFITIL